MKSHKLKVKINIEGDFMTKLILTGVGGNLGSQAATDLLELAQIQDLVFCGYDQKTLDKYKSMGVTVRQTDFSKVDGLAEKFHGGDVLALISMPFVGSKRQNAHKNVIDAAKEAGFKNSKRIKKKRKNFV